MSWHLIFAASHVMASHNRQMPEKGHGKMSLRSERPCESAVSLVSSSRRVCVSAVHANRWSSERTHGQPFTRESLPKYAVN